jgi:hypothetical protein
MRAGNRVAPYPECRTGPGLGACLASKLAGQITDEAELVEDPLACSSEFAAEVIPITHRESLTQEKSPVTTPTF